MSRVSPRALVAVVVCVSVQAACERGAGDAGATAARAPAPPDTLVRIGAGPEFRDSGYVVLDSAQVDVTQDGAADRIELRVQAERGRDGRVLWEDGHHWRLEVRSGGRVYRLLDRFVPWGTVRYWVVEGAGGTAVVFAIESSTGGVQAEEYRYDGASGTFVQSGRLVTEGRFTHRLDPSLLR